MSLPRNEIAGTDEREARRSPWWGIGASRYVFAAPYVSNRLVLDIACGSGYGIALLQQAGAKHVVGADNDQPALLKQSGSRAGGATLAVADGIRLPFKDSSFDAVTSFETLEHLGRRVRFISELGRVLKPDGTLILSTPNANYTNPVNGKPRNPYHLHEYRPDELVDALDRHFASLELLGQTLSPRIHVPPLWEDQQRLPIEFGAQTRLRMWRVLNRFPRLLGDAVSRMLWGHSLFPDEKDYEFSTRTVASAPVLLATGRPRKDNSSDESL